MTEAVRSPPRRSGPRRPGWTSPSAARTRTPTSSGAAPVPLRERLNAERAWLLGRERAQQRHGDAFDLKAWHMQALSLGSLGLDDLVDELSKL